MGNIRYPVIVAGAGMLLSAALSSCAADQTSEDVSEIVEIAIENVILTGKYTETEAVEEAINEITVPAIGCRVSIVNCSIEDHDAMVRKAAAGSQKLDIVNTGLTMSLSQLAADGLILPLDQLLEEYGEVLLEKEGDLLDATTVDGEIYAVSAKLYPGRSMGIVYNADMAAQYGIELPETITIETLTGIGEVLASSESPVYLTTRGNGELTAFDSFYDVETFGGDLNYGVIFDPLESTTIVNVYESGEYREYCLTLQSWRENGYIPGDSLISGDDEQGMFDRGEIFMQWSSVSPATLHLLAKKSLDFAIGLAAMTPNEISTAEIQEMAWGISSSCDRPDKAMELLNLIYDNAEVANLLSNGREGEEYEILEGNLIQYADGLSFDTVGYGSYFSIYGDYAEVFYFGDEGGSVEETISYTSQSQARLTLGYVFHTDAVTSELTSVSQVVAEYRTILETGLADDVDQTLEEFSQALEAAGIDRIIEENQRQLDAWLAGT